MVCGGWCSFTLNDDIYSTYVFSRNNTRQLDIDRNWGDPEMTIVGSVAEHIGANCRFPKSARQPF